MPAVSAATWEAPKAYLLSIAQYQREIDAASRKSAVLFDALRHNPNSVALAFEYAETEALKNRLLERHEQAVSTLAILRRSALEHDDMTHEIKQLLKLEAGLTRKGRKAVRKMMDEDLELCRVYLAQVKCWDEQARGQWMWDLLIKKFDGDIEDVIDFRSLLPGVETNKA